jgi:uncharacterized protein
MFLRLADLSLRGGDRYERTFIVDFQPVLLGGVEYRVLVPDGIHVAVDRATGGYLVSLDLEAKVYGPCARCLGEAVLTVRAQQQEFAPTARDGWEETETSEFIADLVVDVDGLAREALVLALPAQVVCAEDCKGLCPVCGKDLNSGACECAPHEADERWTPLKDLRLEDAEEPST